MQTRYTKALRAATRGYDLCATLIVALTIASVWPNKKLVAIAVLMGLFGAVNTFFNLRIIPKLGEVRGESLRLAYNLVTSLPLAHLLGWPIATFFWMPFSALFMNHLDRRVARSLLLVLCTVDTVVAAIDGVPLLLPIAFVVASAVARISAESNATALCALVDEAEAANARLVEETEARENAQRELENAHKLEALGRLAAGVAHEINTPIQYVGDSIDFARQATTDLLDVFAKKRPAEDADLPFIVENLPLAMDRAREGLDRIAKIVRSMKTFAHPGGGEPVPLDLNEVIESALDVAQSEYRHVAAVDKRLEPLPLIAGRVAEINQVFLNLIVNAAHAVADKKGERGSIHVRSRRDGAHVLVEIADTGVGIPDSIRDKIMEPFFTTKPVGRGTGQGLAIARTVVEAHGGSLAFESKVGLGTTFRVKLPIPVAA